MKTFVAGLIMAILLGFGFAGVVQAVIAENGEYLVFAMIPFCAGLVCVVVVLCAQVITEEISKSQTRDRQAS